MSHDMTPEQRDECVFCEIVATARVDDLVLMEKRVIAFRPLNPVTPGHILVIPRLHVEDFTTNPAVTAETAAVAARLAQHPANLITSAGVEATQSIRHLHFHIVPRREGDGLALPWTGLAANAEQRAALDAAEDKAARFATKLANGARDGNEALSGLARENQRLRDVLHGILWTLDRGERVQFGTIADARALLNPTEAVEFNWPDDEDAPQPDRSSPCTDENGNPTSWPPPNLRSVVDPTERPE